MPDPDTLKFAPSHEWVQVTDENGDRLATVGLSAFALETLTDLVYMELPEAGREVAPGETLCEVESVKAVSEVYSPVKGVVTEVNEALADELEGLGDDPYGRGWICKIRLTGDDGLDGLLDHAQYQQACAKEGA